ncbi:MAG TPA: Sir2 family NAD-dependent protein deacetylase [Candidatus Thermoplasmatota archaeon]|nr:Sir2 family NAD-dependent protein deacetylase [Candidatus Thermoplasmatota archaeon]
MPELAMPVVVLTGAGVSTASGIPDFRSKGGLWDTFDPMEFTIQRFHAEPAAFWSRRVAYITAARHLDAEPNQGHLALARAATDGRIEAIVTQNVDGLHAKAGTPPQRLLEVHGNGGRAVCLRCGAKEAIATVLADVEARPGQAPTCATCGDLLKPDVVLFGEAVTAMPEAAALVARARTLVVAGTSLQVHPAAGLVDLALARGARVVLLNREATAYDRFAAEVRRGPVEDELARLFP